jgi:CRISPR-associated protein Csd1
MQCLITGKLRPVARLHPIINGVYGTQQNRGNIVSFNFAAAESYAKHKQQGANAPVSIEAAEGYAKALNWLLSKDSRQKIGFGDTTVVFWARQPHVLEHVMALWLADDATDDPSPRGDAVRSLYRSLWRGTQADDGDETPFYVLGLAPNAARISIRFWLETTVHAMSENIHRYFEEIAIVTRDDAPPPALRRLLAALAVQRKLENLPPKLEGAVVHGILLGTPYPRSLLGLAVLRAKAEQGVTPSRAALLKAYLIRNCKENYAMALDEQNVCPAYLLGRLFSVLERIQEQASPGLNTTIRERYYSAASSRPASIFPLLLRLKSHHAAKLKGEKPGLAVNLEKLTGQVIDGFKEDFPAWLSLEDQGRFALGYYHQRQTFFTKKESAEAQAA